MVLSGTASPAYCAPRLKNRQWSVAIMSTLAFTVCDLTEIRSSAFMLMYGVVWVSLIWMYWTEVRRAEVIGPRATEFVHKS